MKESLLSIFIPRSLTTSTLLILIFSIEIERLVLKEPGYISWNFSGFATRELCINQSRTILSLYNSLELTSSKFDPQEDKVLSSAKFAISVII